MATLTPEIAQDLIWRSMVTGVPTTEFEKYGGYEAVDAMYKAGGGQYSHDAIPVDLRNQLGQQVAQTGVGNLSILEKTGNSLSAAAIENMAKQGTISSLPLFMERGIPIAEAAMPTAQRYISMLPALTGTLQPTAKPTQQPSLLPPAFSGSGLSIPSAYPSQAQTLDFLSPTGTITPSPQLPVSTLPGYTFSPITTPTVSSIVPSAVPQSQAPVDTQLPSIQQSVQDQFQQRVFGVPRSDIEQFIASRSPQPRVPEYSPMLTPTVSRQQLEQLNRLYGIPQTPPQDDNMQFFREGGAVKKFADGGPSSGVRRLEMSGYKDGGGVSDNPFAQMVEEEQRTQDQLLGNINRQLSELISRYRSGDLTVTEKELLPFFPGYNEYDIAQMYGTTTEATSPRMSEKIKPFTVDMIPNVKRRGEAVESDFDRMVREGKLLDPMMPKRVMELSKGGEVTNDEFIQEMMVGTTPSEESQQTTGEYIKGLYKENIPVHARVYLETLLGKKDPVTAEDFTKEELADIEKLLSSKPAKGTVTEYSDYEKVRDLDREGRHSSDWLENLPSVGKTLGRFTYETLPDGRRVIKDTYDFYNTSRSINVQEFEEMGPAEKALAVFKKITAGRSMMDPPFVKRAADVLGEAYIGRDGRPVKVEYDPKDLPVKRQDGSPSQGEISDDMFLGTRPSDFPETSPVDTAVSDFVSSRSKLVTDPKEFFRVMGQNLEEYHGKPLREDPEKYLMEQLGPGALAGIIKPKGGNVVTQDLMESLKSLRPSVLYEGYPLVRASDADKRIREQMKKEEESGRGISASTKRIFEENKPKAALDDWIQNKLGRYIRTEMGSEDDPVRKLAEEMTDKVRSDYQAGLKRIAKMKERIVDAKTRGKNTDISEAELADEIDKVENAYRQTSKLPVDQGPYLYPSSQTGKAREKAGFSPYPISKSDAGKEWEGTADALFPVHRAGDLVEANSPIYQDNPWIAKLDPDEIVYNPQRVDEPAMFTHTIDELTNALNPTSGLPQNLLLKPEDMQQLSMDKAFRHVNKINDWRAQQRTAANLEEAQRAAVTFKEYPASPGKLKWQELKAPEYTELPPGFRLEDMDYGTAMLKDAQGNILTYIDKMNAKGAVDPLKQALSFLSKNDLERALKYEGSTMRHCVGKYCDAVFSGQTRVFSLRDSRGEPHITIETAPPRTTTETVDQFFRENPSLKKAEGLDDFRYANSPAFPWKEYHQWLKSQPEEVRQVSGKGNDKPSARYIEFGQDFIASKNWSDIQDLDNLDIVPLKTMLLKNAQDRGFNPQVLTMVRDQPYVTKEEFNRIAGLFGGMNKYAAGGEVTNDEFIQQMMTGTPMSDTTTQPGILPPEIRQAVDVPLDFANLLIRGTAAVPIGGAAGLYKGITGGKYGTQEGVKEADTEAARMMAKITGEPKTQTAKDVLQFVGDKAQEYKLDAALPQLLTLPSPGPGAASALSRAAMDKGEERMVQKMREITGNPDLTAKQVYDAMFEKQTPGASVVKMPGGNWLKGQVEYFVRSLKRDIPWTQSQLEEMPDVAKAEAPNLALNKFIETGLTRYIKNDMASAKDTLRNLADENTIKAGKAYNNDLRQVKKAYDRAEKIKAEGPRPNMLPGTWENAIEAQLGRARQLEEEANRKLNLELRHALPFPALQEDGGLAGGLNFLMRRNLQTGGEETLVSRRKEAGQAEEGVAQTPTGKVWETMADLFVKPQAAGQITDQDYFMRSTDSQRVLRNNPWLATVPPETPVYIPQDVFRSSSFLNSFSADDLGFKHITDELANAMNPESGLPANLLLTPDEVANMGMEKAARHVIEVNKWREEQMGVANALRAQKSISLYKDYSTIPGKTEPNQRGLQWLELKLMPEDDTPESMVKAKEALADALKYEGEVMGHCVGGECPKVESGLSRIISLRDAKGEPHVTLEVAPPSVLKTGNNPEDFLSENPEIASQVPSNQSLSQQMGFYQQLVKTPEFQEWLKSKPSAVLQIKGKGNNRPPDSYQPFITDFIASQSWSSVGDLQNTNLVRIEPMILKNAQDRGFNPQIVTTIKERPYITKEEFNRLADLFGGMNKYAAGGEVTDFIKRAA
jgi:hypothetical protein